MVRQHEVTRRSPYSEKGVRKQKLPVAIEADLMERIKKDAESQRITMSFLVSQIVASYYGVIEDPIAALQKRVQRLEEAVFSMPPDSSIEQNEIEISEEMRNTMLTQKGLLDLSVKDLATESGMDLIEVQDILSGAVGKVPRKKIDGLLRTLKIEPDIP